LAAFLADQNMINEILKDQPEMINERLRRADNKTPLMLSCQAGDPKVVELLISKGAELDAVDVFGRTSLMLAAKYDFPEIIELLIKYNFLKNKDNSLVHALSENNLNALMIATDSGAMRAVVS
jgi:ankyrin repeat protein|tara:strand:- start:563 stop:931 length:369 start_codon:yes stop_codon:yes gene_type:complete